MGDKSGDGLLNIAELQKVFKRLCPHHTTDDTERLCVDLGNFSGSGKVKKSVAVSPKLFMEWTKSGGEGVRDVVDAIFKETGDAREARIRQTFNRYDKSGDGSLDVAELHKAFKMMGMFSNDEIRRACADLDKSKDGEVSYQEFLDWIKSGAGSKEVIKAKAVLAPSDDDGVEGAFYNFCGAGHADMDSKSFQKMCKDCNLMDKNLTETNIDLIFNKVKKQKRIDFDQFETALEHVANKKGVVKDDVLTAVLEATRPVFQGTKADYVRFHDDKSTYTGTHKHSIGFSEHKGLTQTPAAPTPDKVLPKLQQRTRIKLKKDPPDDVDNRELWKLFGMDSTVGRNLRGLYSSSSSPQLGSSSSDKHRPYSMVPMKRLPTVPVQSASDEALGKYYLELHYWARGYRGPIL